MRRVCSDQLLEASREWQCCETRLVNNSTKVLVRVLTSGFSRSTGKQFLQPWQWAVTLHSPLYSLVKKGCRGPDSATSRLSPAAVLSSPSNHRLSAAHRCCLKVSASASAPLPAPLDSQLAHHTPAHVIPCKNNLLNALKHSYFIVILGFGFRQSAG